MARRKRHPKPNPVRTWVKRIASGVATLLKAGPALVPATLGLKDGLSSGPEAGINTFIFEAGGYNLNAKQLDQNKLKEVIIRDLALVGTGLLVSWAVKRA